MKIKSLINTLTIFALILGGAACTAGTTPDTAFTGVNSDDTNTEQTNVDQTVDQASPGTENSSPDDKDGTAQFHPTRGQISHLRQARAKLNAHQDFLEYLNPDPSDEAQTKQDIKEAWAKYMSGFQIGKTSLDDDSLNGFFQFIRASNSFSDLLAGFDSQNKTCRLWYVKIRASSMTTDLPILNDCLDYQKNYVRRIQEKILKVAEIYQIELEVVTKSNVAGVRPIAAAFGKEVLDTIIKSFESNNIPLQGQDFVQAAKISIKLTSSFLSAAFTFSDEGGASQYVLFTTFRNVNGPDGFGAIDPQDVHF